MVDTTPDRLTPLVMAAACPGCTPLVCLLLQHGDGAVVNEPDEGGCPAIYFAASQGDTALGAVEALLAAGADPTLANVGLMDGWGVMRV